MSQSTCVHGATAAEIFERGRPLVRLAELRPEALSVSQLMLACSELPLETMEGEVGEATKSLYKVIKSSRWFGKVRKTRTGMPQSDWLVLNVVELGCRTHFQLVLW